MGEKHRRIFYRADFPDKTQIFDPDRSTVLLCLTALLENHEAMPYGIKSFFHFLNL